jgi:hypothetical protein
MNPNAAAAISKSQEARMGYVPAALEIYDISLYKREGMFSKQFFKHLNR